MTKPSTEELHTNSNCQKKKAAHHRVHRTSAGAARTSGDSASLAGSLFGFFLPIPALASNANRCDLVTIKYVDQ
jgi:hypothetical protein